MTAKERIEKLKDLDQAQPFWLRSKEEKAVLTCAGADNVLCVSEDHPVGARTTAPATQWQRGMYVLKRGYELEPECIEIEVVVDKSGMCVLKRAYPCEHENIWWASTHKDFVCFHDDFGKETTNAGNVPGWLRILAAQDGNHKMHARFVK